MIIQLVVTEKNIKNFKTSTENIGFLSRGPFIHNEVVIKYNYLIVCY